SAAGQEVVAETASEKLARIGSDQSVDPCRAAAYDFHVEPDGGRLVTITVRQRSLELQREVGDADLLAKRQVVQADILATVVLDGDIIVRSHSTRIGIVLVEEGKRYFDMLG